MILPSIDRPYSRAMTSRARRRPPQPRTCICGVLWGREADPMVGRGRRAHAPQFFARRHSSARAVTPRASAIQNPRPACASSPAHLSSRIIKICRYRVRHRIAKAAGFSIGRSSTARRHTCAARYRRTARRPSATQVRVVKALSALSPSSERCNEIETPDAVEHGAKARSVAR